MKFRKSIVFIAILELFGVGCQIKLPLSCAELASGESCRTNLTTDSSTADAPNSSIKAAPFENVFLNPANATEINDIHVLNEQLYTPDGDNPWLLFDNLNVADNADLSVTFARTSSNPDYIDQMTLEVRLDSPTGKLMGIANLNDTGGWDSFQTKTISVVGFQGRAFLRFKGVGGVNVRTISLMQSTTRYDDSLKHPKNPINACINLGGSLEAPRKTAPGYWGLQIEAQDLKTIAEAGFDSIRLPVKFSDYADRNPPYLLDSSILQTTDQIIDWAFENDLKVVLDMHLYDELFVNSSAEEDRFIAMWAQIAEHYKNWWDTHLLFEIINEPNDEGNKRSGMTIARTDELNRLVLDKIRESNPDRWVVLGTGQFGTLDGLRMSSPPQDPKVMLSVHYYEPFEFTHQGAEFVNPKPAFGVGWGSAEDRQNLSDEFALVESIRRDFGMPLLLGEYGVIHNGNTDGQGANLYVPNEDRAQWISAVTREAKKRSYGYCHWDYATSFRAYNKAEQVWIPEIIDALR